MTTASVTGLSPVRERLVNGVTLLVEETRAQPAVTIGATMSAGSLCDPSGAEGTAQLLSRVGNQGHHIRLKRWP